MIPIQNPFPTAVGVLFTKPKGEHKMTIHKVLVAKDFIPMGEILSKIQWVLIDFKNPLQNEKLKLALKTAGFDIYTETSYRKPIISQDDATVYFNFHAEWIFTLCEMFPSFSMSYFFVYPLWKHETHHKLEFSGEMEYSVS